MRPPAGLFEIEEMWGGQLLLGEVCLPYEWRWERARS